MSSTIAKALRYGRTGSLLERVPWSASRTGSRKERIKLEKALIMSASGRRGELHSDLGRQYTSLHLVHSSSPHLSCYKTYFPCTVNKTSEELSKLPCVRPHGRRRAGGQCIGRAGASRSWKYVCYDRWILRRQFRLPIFQYILFQSAHIQSFGHSQSNLSSLGC